MLSRKHPVGDLHGVGSKQHYIAEDKLKKQQLLTAVHACKQPRLLLSPEAVNRVPDCIALARIGVWLRKA